MQTPHDRGVTLLLHEAIRADVHTRVDSVLNRLESSVDYAREFVDLEVALENALAEVADAVAEGLVAQLRECRRLRHGAD
ncbi:MAG: hypothetical protein ACE5FP_11040 [Gemmatimonadota bacterium]